MPAERTRGLRRSATDTCQLTWTTPVEPAAPQCISFAPNVTPGTFNAPPPSIEDAAKEAVLFPPTEDYLSTGPKRPAHCKKRPQDHIPRPPNAFILFRSSFIRNQHISTEVETNHSTLSKIIGLTWQNLPPEERQVWHAKAKLALQEHKRRWPQYAFKPLHTKTSESAPKRKVREVGQKDAKRCAKIADLLVEGKRGAELEEAIEEFDRHHVPDVETRFEAPITARMYRRSSSAPLPDSTGPFLSTSPRSRKVRASSSIPTRPSTPCTIPPIEHQQIQPHTTDVHPKTESFYDATYSQSMPSSPTYTFPSSPHAPYNFDNFTFPDHIAASPESTFDCGSDAGTSADTLGMFRLDTTCAQNQILQREASYDSFDSSSPVTPVLCAGQTPYADHWSGSSSPLSTLPSTPQHYDLNITGTCDPMSTHRAFENHHHNHLLSQADASFLESTHFEYEQSFGSLSELQSYNECLSAFNGAGPTLDTSCLSFAPSGFEASGAANMLLFQSQYEQKSGLTGLDFSCFMPTAPLAPSFIA